MSHKPKSFTKTVLRSEECYIQFSEEEMKELGIKPGDKFSWKDNKDGSFSLEKYVEVDINFDDFSREALLLLVATSLEQDITINEAFEVLLTDILEDFKEDTSYSDKKLKECNEGLAKLEKEVKKNKWVHGICNPPSPDWKVQN